MNEQKLSHFRISPKLGFLYEEPLTSLPESFYPLEELANSLPKIILSGQLRKLVHETIPLFDIEKLQTRRQIERAMLLYSLIGHAYLHGNALLGENPTQHLPHHLAKPWYQLSTLLKRPPVLSHASIVLNNWKYIDPSLRDEPVNMFNITTLNNFNGCFDEDWFYIVTADIEARAAPGIVAAFELTKLNHVENNLKIISSSLEEMKKSLNNMKLQCSPYIFYHRVRTYLSAWEKGSEKFPNGVIFDGVSNIPQFAIGGSAGQSSIMHTFDELFKIKHSSPLLNEMREYMPMEHKEFINYIAKHDALRDFITDKDDEKLKKAYNDCLEKIINFRSLHIRIVALYIISQSKDSTKEKGTGSSNLLPFLKTIRDDVLKNIIK